MIEIENIGSIKELEENLQIFVGQILEHPYSSSSEFILGVLLSFGRKQEIALSQFTCLDDKNKERLLKVIITLSMCSQGRQDLSYWIDYEQIVALDKLSKELKER